MTRVDPPSGLAEQDLEVFHPPPLQEVLAVESVAVSSPPGSITDQDRPSIRVHVDDLGDEVCVQDIGFGVDMQDNRTHDLEGALDGFRGVAQDVAAGFQVSLVEGTSDP